MPHLHTMPGGHDQTASALIIRIDGSEPRVLFHKHKKLGRYMQFGGHIEPTENPWQTITHELREETGYNMSQLKILQPSQRITRVPGAIVHPVPLYHQTHEFKDNTHFHTDICYVFVTSEAPAQQTEVGESTELVLFIKDELLALPAEKTFESIRQPALYALDVCLKQWQAIDPHSFD